jgi:hypothetical protein
MAFRNPAAALVQVGLAPGRQVIIDPTQAGQITFPNPGGFTPAAIGTSAGTGLEQLQITGPVVPGTTDQTLVQLSDSGTSAVGNHFPRVVVGATQIDPFPNPSLRSNIIIDAAGGISMSNADDGSFAFAALMPFLIKNSAGFGGNGSRWLAQITYHPNVATVAGAVFTLNLPNAMPAGFISGFTWPSVFASSNRWIHFSVNPTGAQISLVATATATDSGAVLTVLQYP